jgi:ubiquinone/menaquinone biosynthesis C-methylase UbiE
MNSILDQEKYWDKVADEKEFPTPFQMEEFEKYVSKDMDILDIGCGYGRTLNELYNQGFKNLKGIDYSQGMINRGLRIHPYLNLRKNDGDKIPFPDGKFDAVILIAVLTSNFKNEEQKRLMSEISRVLKDDGILYINDYLINDDRRNIERYEKFKDKYKLYGVFELPEGAIFRHHTKEHILKLTKDFKKLVFKETVYDTMNGNKSNGFYSILKYKQH